ncbi:MAG: phosphate ABC transporter substrate-binding protein [Eubacteriales bacterium]
MKKLSIVLLILILSLSFVVGCQQEDANTDDQGTGDETTPLTGEVKGGGSTSVQPILEAARDEFMAQNPDVTVEYNGTGSSDGVTGANDGVYMFGCASREQKDEEKEWGLTEQVFANDGIAVIVHPNNEVSDISMEDIAKVFKGEITNWKDLGGADAPIVVVSREDGSGTRGAFEEIVGFEDELTSEANVQEGNGAVQTTVAGNENAIGYVSFTYIDDTIKDLTVEGAEATPENVTAGTYPVSRPFIMIYHEENLNESAQAFIDFIMSDEGQAIVEEEGAIPIN